MGHESRKQFSKAIYFCEKILERNPCREDIHRRLMNCYLAQGQKEKALSQFQACAVILARELGISPSQPTIDLLRQLDDDPLGR